MTLEVGYGHLETRLRRRQGCRVLRSLGYEGFVRVNPTPLAVSYPWIFVAEYVVSIEGRKLPRSDVFAVRMAKPLEHSLRDCLSGRLIKNYKPQRHSLSPIDTANGRAIASYNDLAIHSVFFWWLKNQIDPRFMRQFQ